MSRGPKSVGELLGILNDSRSIPDLRTYFNLDRPGDRPQYSGSCFDTLDGGGARDAVKYAITPYDLLAVTCLDVTVPASVGLDLVQGSLGRKVAALLHQIPCNFVLGEGGANELVKAGSSADQAWWLLDAEDKVGWVTAGKVLARKRPHLIPVWDNVVRCAFGQPRENAWLWLDGRLREGDGRLKEALDQLHWAAALPALVSRLRVLDVVMWMRHRSDHRRNRCPGLQTPMP